MKNYFMTIIFTILACNLVFCQGSNTDYKRVKIGEAKNIICGLDMSPDNEYIAISSTQSFPFFIFDWENEKVIKKHNVGNWYAGSSVRHSPDGQYVLLQQLYFLDFAPNKDREVNFEIVESSTGKRVKRFDEFHAVAFTPDSKSAVTLTADQVSFWDLASGKKGKSFKINQATNGIAVSPDGKHIAVSHKVNEDDIKKDPRYKKNKKGLKHVLKYKQQISVFDAETFQYEYTVNELYDIVYRLEYSDDGNTLFCLQIPHLKAQATGNVRQTYISTINGTTGEAQRKGFTSKSDYEPDFKLSHDGKLFGLVSKGNRFLEIHIYEFETGKMLSRFEQSFRLFEKNEGGMIAADSRSSFVFLPDNKTVVMTMGNHLIYWNLNL